MIAARQFRTLLGGKLITPSSSWVPSASILYHNEAFIQRNKKLNRPMSPHLTIYKFELPANLSITHRGTGMIMSGALSGFSIGMLILPGSFPYYLNYVESLQFGSAIIGAAKFLIAWPFMYHMCNGVRHLFWDAGKGFDMKVLYKTGYAVVISSILLSLGVAVM